MISKITDYEYERELVMGIFPKVSIDIINNTRFLKHIKSIVNECSRFNEENSLIDFFVKLINQNNINFFTFSKSCLNGNIVELVEDKLKALRFNNCDYENDYDHIILGVLTILLINMKKISKTTFHIPNIDIKANYTTKIQKSVLGKRNREEFEEKSFRSSSIDSMDIEEELTESFAKKVKLDNSKNNNQVLHYYADYKGDYTYSMLCKNLQRLNFKGASAEL